jgi:hypothetical protein
MSAKPPLEKVSRSPLRTLALRLKAKARTKAIDCGSAFFY